MAQTDTQDFGSLLQTFMVDLDGDGVPDVQVQAPARERGVQVADARSKIAGGLAGIGAAAVAPLVDMKVRGDDSAVARYFEGRMSQPPPSQAAPSRGGVLDTLGIPQPAETTPSRNPLMQGLDMMGQAAGVADYYAMGIPSTMAGLVNSAIPGQPLGGLEESKSASNEARQAAARTSLGRDALALPEAFSGVAPGAIRSSVGRNALMPPEPERAARGMYKGVPNVYQKPFEYFPNDIKLPAGAPIEPAPTRRQVNVDYYTDLYAGDPKGQQGRAVIDNVGSNRINQTIFLDTKKYAPVELAQIKARVDAGDVGAARQWQRLKEAAAEVYGLDIETMKPLQPNMPPKPDRNR